MNPIAEIKVPEGERLDWERKSIRKLIEIHPEFRSTLTVAQPATATEEAPNNIIPFPFRRMVSRSALRRRRRLSAW